MQYCLDEDAHEELLNLSPSELKNLIYHILSGKEFRIDQDSECTGSGYPMRYFLKISSRPKWFIAVGKSSAESTICCRPL